MFLESAVCVGVWPSSKLINKDIKKEQTMVRKCSLDYKHY